MDSTGTKDINPPPPHRCKTAVVGLALATLLLSSTAASALDKADYRLTWRDEFSGPARAKPSPHWFFFDGWGTGKFRDTYYTDKDAYLDGAGHLAMRLRVQNGKFMTSYLQTYDWKVPQDRWTTFGPGRGKYIEAKVNFSSLQAHGPWVAFWLFDPSDTYDGNPHNGSEIDIMEYVRGGNGWWDNRFSCGNIWGAGLSGGEIIDAASYQRNLRAGWHTFGLEWTATRLTYYLDGIKVYTTNKGVETGNGEALMLTVEYDQGPGDAWGINQNVLNHQAVLPDFFLVDYVRVYEKR